MKKSKYEMFIEELNILQEKYNIYIQADYEEEIDYNWDEEPYVSGVHCYLAYYDSDGVPIPTNEN